MRIYNPDGQYRDDVRAPAELRATIHAHAPSWFEVVLQPGDYREELRELRALLEEARREAEKDEPNGVKLKAILADCRDMFRTVAALDPMWQGIQRIARMVGID